MTRWHTNVYILANDYSIGHILMPGKAHVYMFHVQIKYKGTHVYKKGPKSM